MKYSIKNLLMIILTMLSIFVSAVGVTPAAAATIWTVNSTVDPGDVTCDLAQCTLREAIAAAAPGDTITFDSTLAGTTITLNSTLVLNKDLTISGATLASQITISGGGLVRVFQVDAGSTVTFNSLKIVNGNSGTAQGGAILISSGATVTITNSTFNNNTSAYNSLVTGIPGGGGAISNAGTLTISGSTFSGNTATGLAGDGGGILSEGSITISNSTFYNNSATTPDGAGGAVRLNGGSGPNTLIHVTFSGNASNASFGALDITRTSATLRSSILANSTSGLDCTVRLGGSLTSSNNLIENGSACSPVITSDPGLGPLQDNGGPTQTMALSALSPALGAGDLVICGAAPVSGKDQRGEVRPQGDTRCDIGAFEANFNNSPSLLSFTRKTPATSPTNADSLTFHATFSEPVQNVDVSDFAVTGTTASISNPVTSDGGLTYDITVSGGDLALLNGTVGLDLQNTQDIADLSGLSLPDGDPTTDETYVVDNLAPVATINVFPSNPSNSPVANFGFSATDGVSSVFSFSCNLDSAGWVDCSTNPISNGGTKSYSGLTEGAHTFQLDVVDAAGNSLTPNFEEYSWTIDLPPGAPTVTAPTGTINNNTPTISGTAQANSSVDVSWLNGASWQPIPDCQDVVVNGSGNWSCVSDVVLPEGDINLRVYATDTGGTSDPPAAHTFTVDVFFPEIQVLDGVTDIPDGTGAVNFGSTPVGAPLVKTFTVKNNGEDTLTLTGPVSLPSGFSLESGFGSASLAPAASTTFQVKLNAGTAGNYAGEVSFGNNDGDENPFNFTISGTTRAATLINFSIGGLDQGTYPPQNSSLQRSFASTLGGPVKVVSTNGEPFVTSQRVFFGDSFNELMGYPVDQFTTEYWFPWYDMVYMNTWILVGNPSTTQTAYVDIYIGGVKKNNTPGGVPYAIPPGDRVLPQFPGVLDGPVRVVSVTGTGTPTAIPIFASERSTYLSSFNEVMGYPTDQLTTEYWFPWYDMVYMNSWVLVGNPSDTQTAYVDIYIAGVKQNNTPGGIPYAIPPNGRVLPQFPGVLDGPVQVVSVTGEGTSTPLPVFASERSTYQGSFNEVMGYPADQFTTEYWYPWFQHNTGGMSSWLLVGNPSNTQTAYVDIYIGGVKQNSTYVIPPSGSIIPQFNLSQGPVRVVSVTGTGTPTAIPIFTSERSLYGPSFNEVMGYPADQLSSEYWFTWYDSVYMATDLVVGVP